MCSIICNAQYYSICNCDHDTNVQYFNFLETNVHKYHDRFHTNLMNQFLVIGCTSNNKRRYDYTNDHLSKNNAESNLQVTKECHILPQYMIIEDWNWISSSY